MKDSLAASLRHSREQAQSTYDRRTHNTKKAAAMELARTLAEDFADQGGSASGADVGEVAVRPPVPPKSKTERKFKPGDFVACVEDGSTPQNPLILVGRVQFYASESEVCLLWYSKRSNKGYGPRFDGEQWIEAEDCLTAVEMVPTKGKSGLLSLRTSPRSIHRSLDG